MMTNPQGWVYTSATRASDTILMVDGNHQLWGANTLQRPSTALDRVGVRRLLFYIEKQLRQIMRNHLAGDDHLGWLDFDVFSFMDDIKKRRGVVEYQFVTDDDCVMLGICPRINSPWIWTTLTVG